MWLDRLTGETTDSLPEYIESGRYLVVDEPVSGRSRQCPDEIGLLVDDGGESSVISGPHHTFGFPPKALESKQSLFERILETIDANISDREGLVSPLMPEVIG